MDSQTICKCPILVTCRTNYDYIFPSILKSNHILNCSVKKVNIIINQQTISSNIRLKIFFYSDSHTTTPIQITGSFNNFRIIPQCFNGIHSSIGAIIIHDNKIKIYALIQFHKTSHCFCRFIFAIKACKYHCQSFFHHINPFILCLI